MTGVRRKIEDGHFKISIMIKKICVLRVKKSDFCHCDEQCLFFWEKIFFLIKRREGKKMEQMFYRHNINTWDISSPLGEGRNFEKTEVLRRMKYKEEVGKRIEMKTSYPFFD